MSRPIPPTVALALLLAAPSVAAEKITDVDLFGLWHGCYSMGLLVSSEGAADIGLTKEAITVAARSKLRAARLYRTDPGTPFLFVRVHVVRTAFHISVDYIKWVEDSVSGVSRPARTWERLSTGTHRRDASYASYILSAVSQKMDEFIDEYLRVNRNACDKWTPAQ